MADENNTNIQPNTGNPPIPDFLNMEGGISADSLAAPSQQPNNGMPDFANAPGAISVEALEKAEKEMAQNQPAFQPVNIPTPPAPGQPMQMAGGSGFDSNAMNSFFDKYNGGAANSVDYTKTPQQQQAAGGISNRQQAAILNNLLMGGTGAEAAPQPAAQRNRQQPVEEQKRPMPGTDMQCGCACSSTCKNTSCVFYGKSNYMSINDIIEDEIQARIEELIDSGELDVRKFEHRKNKLKSNKYLSDISDSLLGLEA